MTTALVWFRRDLRLADNEALAAAIAEHTAVVPVFIWNPGDDPLWPQGAASRWYLRESLAALASELTARGSRLLELHGDPVALLPQLARACDATAVYWSRRYEPSALRGEAAAEAALQQWGIAAHPHTGSLLVEPWAITSRTGAPYQVFTPYWREFLANVRVQKPLAAPGHLPGPARWPAPHAVASTAAPARWEQKLAAHWVAGEIAARDVLREFVAQPADRYTAARDRVDLDATSRLSPRLHHGELSPRQVWAAIGTAARASGIPDETWRAGKFCAEVIWREFAAHALYHFPELPDRSFQTRYEALEWREAPTELRAWQQGRTGIDLVDAGMRELWETGWMHNRARMVCASFLVKNLLIHWHEGARWFWDTLVDADLASNSLNWQWVAGTGPDAAPWFRIFNPDTQAEKFDPQGDYRRRWLDASGRSKVPPIADLATTRQRALAAQKNLQRNLR